MNLDNSKINPRNWPLWFIALIALADLVALFLIVT